MTIVSFHYLTPYFLFRLFPSLIPVYSFYFFLLFSAPLQLFLQCEKSPLISETCSDLWEFSLLIL